jgi:hopanoid biosynthesis associated RND transporter like protein HpnN
MVLVHPALDFTDITPGQAASTFIRDQAEDLGFTPANGYRVRLTGPVALTDDNFATVVKGAGLTGLLSTAAILILLWLAVRSVPLVLAIVGTLACGLAMTAAFAALTVGTLNPISVAFAVMFVGIAVDFAIQFVVRYRDLRHGAHSDAQAIASCALVIVNPLGLAALASAAGFLSFLPTEYRGVSQLGLIAGGGMIIALIIDLTLLPALLRLIRPRGHREMAGLPLAAPLDRAMRNYGKFIVGAALALGLAGLALTPKLHFDINTLNLQDPKAEAVSTLADLARSIDSDTYFIDTLAKDDAQAKQWVKTFEAMPEVARAAALPGFVPDDQDAKLALISDISDIYQSVLAEGVRLPPPSPEETAQSLRHAADQLRTLASDGRPAVPQALVHDLEQLADSPAAMERLNRQLDALITPNVTMLRGLLAATAIGLGDLPGDLVEEWRTTDGRYKVTVWPKGDTDDTGLLERFVHAVQTVDPMANGMPVSMTGAGNVVVQSFAKAALYAVAAILILLGLVLRRWLDAVLVIFPLILGALFSVIGCVALGLSINFANIIALPLLLGIGVAFNIYFVTNWRAGVKDHLSTATGRAVLFSALTTSSAFGSLAVSPHVGTASMGLLLFLSVGLSVATTFLVLPALLNLIPHSPNPKESER